MKAGRVILLSYLYISLFVFVLIKHKLFSFYLVVVYGFIVGIPSFTSYINLFSMYDVYG